MEAKRTHCPLLAAAFLGVAQGYYGFTDGKAVLHETSKIELNLRNSDRGKEVGIVLGKEK